MYDFKHEIEVVNGSKVSAKIDTKEKFVYPLTEQEKEKLKIIYDYRHVVDAPLKKGTAIGVVQTFLGKNLLFSEKIYTIEDIKSRSIPQRIKDFFSNW